MDCIPTLLHFEPDANPPNAPHTKQGQQYGRRPAGQSWSRIEDQNLLRLLIHLSPGGWRIANRRRLAEDLGVSEGTVTRVADRAEAGGLVDVIPGWPGRDPMPTRYRLTDRGRETLLNSPGDLLADPATPSYKEPYKNLKERYKGTGVGLTRRLQGLGGLGHPAWKESAFGLSGLIVGAHLVVGGPRFVAPAEVGEWLGEEPKAAWKRLDRWAKRGRFCERSGKRFLVFPPEDLSGADHVAGPVLMARQRKVLDGYAKAVEDHKKFRQSDPADHHPDRDYPHYEAGRQSLADWLEDNSGTTSFPVQGGLLWAYITGW